MHDNHHPLRAPIIMFAGILALGMILTGAVGSYAFLKAKRIGEVVTVTGSARKDVVSDTGKIYISFSRPAKTATLGSAYAAIAQDARDVVEYLKSQGFSEESITVGAVNAEEVWDQNERVRKDYTLRQSVEVMSQDVPLIERASKDITSLAAKGIVLNSNTSYTYSKLPEERVALLSQALDDAKARAEAISEKSGRSIGQIQSASSGVVQVLAPGSVDVQDYGSYDTSTIDKTVMVTVKVSFSLK